MFICVSPNPAIDKRLTAAAFARGHVNRIRTAQGFPGGKSAHVAMVLRTLGEQPHWIGPCGGANGQDLAAGLSALGIQVTACHTQQRTRTNLEIVEDDGTLTEILEPGPVLCPDEAAAFESACKDLFARGGESATVIFSGSLPAGAPPDLYARLIATARQFGCRTFLDTSGEPLRLAAAANPSFVKPNREEVTQLFGAPVDSVATAVSTVRKLLELGAGSAAISLGAEGLLFCAERNAPVLFAAPLPMRPHSTVGCGDSALAGFALGLTKKLLPEETLRLAAACAAANCVADSPGTARLNNIEDFRRQIKVQTLGPER